MSRQEARHSSLFKNIGYIKKVKERKEEQRLKLLKF